MERGGAEEEEEDDGSWLEVPSRIDGARLPWLVGPAINALAAATAAE